MAQREAKRIAMARLDLGPSAQPVAKLLKTFHTNSYSLAKPKSERISLSAHEIDEPSQEATVPMLECLSTEEFGDSDTM